MSSNRLFLKAQCNAIPTIPTINVKMIFCNTIILIIVFLVAPTNIQITSPPLFLSIIYLIKNINEKIASKYMVHTKNNWFGACFLILSFNIEEPAIRALGNAV